MPGRFVVAIKGSRNLAISLEILHNEVGSQPLGHSDPMALRWLVLILLLGQLFPTLLVNVLALVCK